MRRTSWALLLLCACHASRSAEEPGDARALLAQAIEVLATQPLGREQVDWRALHAELERDIAPDADVSAAHPAILTAVARLGDPHARFVPPPAPVAVVPPGAEAPAQPASAASLGPTIPTQPEGRMLDGQVAYLLLPGCGAAEVDALRAYAIALRETIGRLESQQPRGWIVDLRLNGGGNIWPMLLGLQPLLGDGDHASAIAPEGMQRLGCDAVHAWLRYPGNPTPVEQLRIDAPAGSAHLAPARIAVLTGAWTMSSGEIIALAFHGRDGSRSFGEPTAGMTTATNYFPLADGSILNLPIAWQADRAGWAPRGVIAPDEPVENGTWPSSSDATAQRAADWLR